MMFQDRKTKGELKALKSDDSDDDKSETRSKSSKSSVGWADSEIPKKRSKRIRTRRNPLLK